MSSYHTSFDYMNKNSAKDFGLLVVHFDNYDSGEVDSYLSTETVYRDSYKKTKRTMFGARYTDVAKLAITVIHSDESEFSIVQSRALYRWLTGAQKYSWINLYIGDEVKYRLHGVVQDVKPYKMDSRILGFTIYIESSSPWCYGNIQQRTIPVLDNGIFSIDCKSDESYITMPMKISFRRCTMGNMVYDSEGTLRIAEEFMVYNESDDELIIQEDIVQEDSGYIALGSLLSGDNHDFSIQNRSIESSATMITDIANQETITLTENLMIQSTAPSRVFGSDFNYVFPQLVSGNNEFTVAGQGELDIEYVEVIKVGDCVLSYNNEVIENIPTIDSGLIDYICQRLSELVDID